MSAESQVIFSEDELQLIMHKHLVCTLANKTYTETSVNDWCREISNGICDEIRSHTEANGHSRKIVVSTFIGSRDVDSEKDTVHVTVRNERNSDVDLFVTLAMKAETLYAWAMVLVV